MAITLTEGQRHDSVPVPQVIAQASCAGTIIRVTADRTYDGDPIRGPLLDQNIEMVIPSPSHRREPAFCPAHLYRLRHKVENYFRTLFDFRRVATRYAKYADCYLAFVHIVATTVLLRSFR